VTIVWPSLLGPGWGQQLLLAAIMQGAITAVVVWLWRAACRVPVPREPDAALALWRRYEQGDLTAQEFRRLRRAAPAAAGAPPAGRRVRRATVWSQFAE
jgi:hypothetical protein